MKHVNMNGEIRVYDMERGLSCIVLYIEHPWLVEKRSKELLSLQLLDTHISSHSRSHFARPPNVACERFGKTCSGLSRTQSLSSRRAKMIWASRWKA